MTLEEAIKILGELKPGYVIIEQSRRIAALQQGIEALKAIVAEREQPTDSLINFLPGETEE